MSKATRATQMLEQAGISFTVRTYDYDPDSDRIGLQAAEALGVQPHLVFKTLMTRVDDKAICAVIPSDHELSMKKLACVFGGKHALMMQSTEAERVSQYKVGGISPFGLARRVPTVFDQLALTHERIFINGGQRGLQVQLDPRDALRVLDARIASLIA